MNFELIAIAVLVTANVVGLCGIWSWLVFIESSLSGLLGFLLLFLFALASARCFKQNYFPGVVIQIEIQVGFFLEVVVAIWQEMRLSLNFLDFIQIAF